MADETNAVFIVHISRIFFVFFVCVNPAVIFLVLAWQLLPQEHHTQNRTETFYVPRRSHRAKKS